MKRIIIELVALAALALLCCVYVGAESETRRQQSSSTSTPEAGSLRDLTYTNDYFGLELKIPEAWNVYDAQGKRMVIEKGSEELTSSDPKIKEKLDASVDRTINLLTVSKLPQDQSSLNNAIFACGAERLDGVKTKTGEDYLSAMKQLLQYAKVDYQIESDVGSETINGSDFGVLTLKIERPEVTIRQKYYSIVKRDHALFCISTYTNDIDRQLMDKSIKSIRFK